MTKPVDQAAFAEGAAFVLGGSGGLGQAICEAFARHGQPVALSYHGNKAAADRTVAQLAERGVKASAWQLDAGDREGVFRTVEAAAQEFGGLHSVVYAGGPPFTPSFFSRTPPEVWSEWLNKDLYGGINLAQAALPELRKTRGAFLTLSTYQNNRIEVQGSVSTISKAGLDRAVAAIAREEGRYGVRANSLRVGWIAVKGPLQLLEDIPGLREEKARTIPLGRLGTPEELGDAAVFLCSRRAGFINGVNLTIDGGESV